MHVHSGYVNVGKKKTLPDETHMPSTVAWRGCRPIIKYHRNHRKPQTGVM